MTKGNDEVVGINKSKKVKPPKEIWDYCQADFQEEIDELNKDVGIKEHWDFKQRAMYVMKRRKKYFVEGREDIVITHYGIYSFVVDFTVGLVFRFIHSKSEFSYNENNRITIQRIIRGKPRTSDIFYDDNLTDEELVDFIKSKRSCGDGGYVGFSVRVKDEDSKREETLTMRDHQLIALLGIGLAVIEAVGENSPYQVDHIYGYGEGNEIYNLQLLPTPIHQSKPKPRITQYSVG